MFAALLMSAAVAQAQPATTPKEIVQPPAKVRVFKRSKMKPTAAKPTAQKAPLTAGPPKPAEKPKEFPTPPAAKVEPTKSPTAQKLETLTAPTATNPTCPGGNCHGTQTSTRSGLFGRRR